MLVTTLYDRFLGHRADERLRHLSVQAAIFGFLLHLLLCLFYQLDLIGVSEQTSGLFDSYLDALYTPFSIFLAYEVYELIRTIPDSFTNSIGKQFEIITLLVVRDILKRLSDIDASVSSTIDDSITILAVECLAFVLERYHATGVRDLLFVYDYTKWGPSQSEPSALAEVARGEATAK